MNYIEFKKKYGLLFYILFPSFVAVLAVFWKESVFAVFGLLLLIALLEHLLVKCPYCRHRVSKPFSRLPDNCPHCGKELHRRRDIL